MFTGDFGLEPWENAISAESYPLNGGPINLYGKSNPIRYLLYLTNQKFVDIHRHCELRTTNNSARLLIC